MFLRRLAVLSVGPYTGGVGHDVGDVVLLVHPVKQVGHGAFGVDRYVLSGVGLVVQWDEPRLLVESCS